MAAAVQTNVAPFDWWSLVHFGSGLVLGAWELPLPETVAGLLAFEVLEWSFEHPSGWDLMGTKEPESQVNVAADIGLALLGYALMRHYCGGASLYDAAEAA